MATPTHLLHEAIIDANTRYDITADSLRENAIRSGKGRDSFNISLKDAGTRLFDSETGIITRIRQMPQDGAVITHLRSAQQSIEGNAELDKDSATLQLAYITTLIDTLQAAPTAHAPLAPKAAHNKGFAATETATAYMNKAANPRKSAARPLKADVAVALQKASDTLPDLIAHSQGGFEMKNIPLNPDIVDAEFKKRVETFSEFLFGPADDSVASRLLNAQNVNAVRLTLTSAMQTVKQQDFSSTMRPAALLFLEKFSLELASINPEYSRKIKSLTKS